MAKKKTTEKALNIDNILFNCRDYLRAARNSGSFFEKRDMMLTLVFLRFIGEKYEDGIENLKQTLKEQGLDPEDENIRAAFFDDATFADGTYNLPPEARWSTIISTPAPQLNVALDTALQRLEEEDPQLKGCFVKGTFTARNLAANDIKKIVDEVNKISHKTFGEEKDLIGRVYEYFLKEFAVTDLYMVFYLTDEGKKIIDPMWLYIYFRRSEFCREVKFRNFGSQRPEFNFNDMSDIVIPLPDIEIQKKYVDIYNAMLENQKSYEHGLDDLKLSFEALLDEYKHKVEKMPIGSLLKEVDNRNMNGSIKNVQGINITKQFMPSVANTNGVDLSKYKVVNKGQFVFSGMQTGRDKCIRIALFDKVEPIIISPAYAVLEIIDADVLAEYVMMWFLRKEVDRLGWFMSDGSIRTNLDMDCFYEIEIPVPDINVQKSIVEIYNAYNVRRDINEKLKEQIKDICPILIKGSIEEARKAKEA